MVRAITQPLIQGVVIGLWNISLAIDIFQPPILPNFMCFPRSIRLRLANPEMKLPCAILNLFRLLRHK